MIDSHCHIHNVDMFHGKSTQEILRNATSAGVNKIVVIGTDFKDSLLAQDFASGNSSEECEIFWTYGIHPSEFEKLREEINFAIAQPIAIGEIGLDYHYGPEFYMTNEGEFARRNLTAEEIREEQIKLLNEMLELAVKNNLPVSFHVREAFDDFFGVLNNFPDVKGVIHSFTDNKKNLAKCLDRGFYIGVNGIATYSTLPLAPMDRILTETDAPYLAPVPHRGEVNEPAYIRDIVEWISVQYKVSAEEVEKQVEANFKELFVV